MRIFVDMDGTLARFHDEVGYLERMFEKGFFSGLQPFQQAVQAINDLARYSKDCELFILSATVDGEPPYCCDEKNQWLDRYCPEIDQAHRLFTKIGISKSEKRSMTPPSRCAARRRSSAARSMTVCWCISRCP